MNSVTRSQTMKTEKKKKSLTETIVNKNGSTVILLKRRLTQLSRSIGSTPVSLGKQPFTSSENQNFQPASTLLQQQHKANSNTFLHQKVNLPVENAFLSYNQLSLRLEKDISSRKIVSNSPLNSAGASMSEE